MRALLVYGCLALYLLAAYVPPTGVNMRVSAKEATHVAASVLPHAKTFVSAASTVATGVQAALSKTGVVPDKKTVIAAVKTQAGQTLSAAAEQSLAALIKGEKITLIKNQLELIQWAGRKSDVRACKDFRDVPVAQGSSGEPASSGDYLAYCLARTTREAARCSHIQKNTNPPLRELCEKEFQSSI